MAIAGICWDCAELPNLAALILIALVAVFAFVIGRLTKGS